MQLVAEKAEPEQGPALAHLIQTPTNPTTTTPNPREAEQIHRAAWKAGVIGALNALALVLAVRFTLLVAIVGAIILSVIAIQAPDPWRLGALGIYAAIVVMPTIWLASRR